MGLLEGEVSTIMMLACSELLLPIPQQHHAITSSTHTYTTVATGYRVGLHEGMTRVWWCRCRICCRYYL